MSTISASEARATLSELLDRVEAGEEITVTRHDRPVAVIIAPNSVRTRRAAAAEALERAADVGRRLAAARHEPLAPEGSVSAELAELWLREIRAERDAD